MMLRIQIGVAAVVLVVCAAVHAQTAVQKDSVQKSVPSPVVAAPQLPVVSGGQVLDEEVAIVNGDLILDSDVDEEQRFEGVEPFRDTQAMSREQRIERLINRDLILQQARLQPEDEISNEAVDKEITELRKNIPACKEYDCQSKAGWDKFLAAHGFTEDVLRERWRTRMEVLRFVEERFRQGIKITDAEIKTYYEKQMLPVYAKQGATAPKLSEISDRIQEVLLEQRVSSLLGDWLKSLRAQGSVVVLHPGEGAP